MSDEARQLSRLREQQQWAIQETREKIQQLEKFRKDYETLKTRLLSLPDKVAYDIMVPIGKKAFMPGRMVHTNEILVLLGDNWFAEQSAKQSADIVDRRMAALDKQISDLKQQEGLLKPRLDFTSELEGMTREKAEIFEIKEEYDPEKEKQWKEEHRKRVKEHRMKLRQEREKEREKERSLERGGEKEEQKTDEEIWARLDQLERQEALDREMDRISDDDNASEKKTSSLVVQQSSSEKTIKWEGDDDSDDDDDGDDISDGDDDDDKHDLRQKSVLHFKHSSTHWQNIQETGPAAEGGAGITNPADIYKYFVKPGPTSILKNPIRSSESAHMSTPAEPPSLPSRITSFQEEAFTGAVIEKSPTLHQVSAPQTDEPPKRISKFKAQRMQQNR